MPAMRTGLGGTEGNGGEERALALLAALCPPPPPGEVWLGDDAAVVRGPGGTRLLLAADAVVMGVDADPALTSLADFGWKALAVNLSDIAAMGGEPGHALVTVIGIGPDDLELLYQGLLEASAGCSCPVVGGDLSGGSQAVVSVAVTGWVDGSPVLRSGARPGDSVWVSGPLGAAAAGLRLLQQAGPGGTGDFTPPQLALVAAHARPRPELAAGRAARRAGATAMIDVSDGFSLDISRLADSSGVGLDLEGVPVTPGATLEEALSGGEDYVLAFTCPPGTDLPESFSRAGLSLPVYVGRCTDRPGDHRLAGVTLPARGWEHSF